MKSNSIFGCFSGTHCLLSTSSSIKGEMPETEQEETATPFPPAIEVFPSDIQNSKPLTTEPVNLQGGFTLLKGRVNSAEILGVGNTDLVPGKYEGGLKLWECAVDLVNILQGEIKDGSLSFRGKRVLELGCGHGLPGIYACLKGASAVHFQDFNTEVLRNLTIPNVNANLDMARARQTPTKAKQLSPEVHYYAGDWSKMDKILLVVDPELSEQVEEENGGVDGLDGDNLQDSLMQDFLEKQSSAKISKEPSKKHSKKLPGNRACDKRINGTGTLEGGYDIILMSETVYSISSLPKLFALIKKCLRPPYGVVYLAGKKHYFGVGGGTRPFKNLVEEDGFLGAHLVSEIADGSSNVREVWKFFFRKPS